MDINQFQRDMVNKASYTQFSYEHACEAIKALQPWDTSTTINGSPTDQYKEDVRERLGTVLGWMAIYCAVRGIHLDTVMINTFNRAKAHDAKKAR